MKRYLLFISIISAGIFYSCSENHDAAKQHLTNARGFLSVQDFTRAKAEIDSINILYPKSFDQRKEGMALLDSIRKAENIFTIAKVDSQLVKMNKELEILKKDFLFEKDAKYQEIGSYVPKLTGATGILAYTTLQSGVEENGRLYLESIFIGSQKHNKIKVSAGDQFAESLKVEGDGNIHRFTDLGKAYETIRLSDVFDNGVARFIAENADKNLKVTLTGNNTSTYTLPQNVKNAIKKSYQLSTHLLLMDSLRTEKEKAEYKNFYLDNGKRTEVPIEETEQTETTE